MLQKSRFTRSLSVKVGGQYVWALGWRSGADSITRNPERSVTGRDFFGTFIVTGFFDFLFAAERPIRPEEPIFCARFAKNKLDESGI